jgi:5-methylcytosine-specific restriction endonuclease McrA
MAFTDLTRLSASYRQSKWDGWGSWCARCGVALAGKKAEAVQRTPAEKGGQWDVDNCVILCPDCFKKTGSHKDGLPDSEIPYYHRHPDNWHGNSSYAMTDGQTSSGVKF